MTINRVTFSSQQLALKGSMGSVQRQYDQAAAPVMTGRRLNSLSDDSSSLSHLFSLRNQVSQNEQYSRNIAAATFRLTSADQSLSQATDALHRLRDFAMQAQDPTITPTLRQQIGSQIADLKSEFLGYANAKADNKYVFSGAKTDVVPFSGSPVSFHGDQSKIQVQANANLKVASNLDGSELFSGVGGGVDLFAMFDTIQTAVLANDSATIATQFDAVDKGVEQLTSGRAKVGMYLHRARRTT